MLAKYPEGSCTVILQLYKEHEQASVGDESMRLGITDKVLHDIPSVLKTTAGCW
jgi:acyl-CoA-binding protein